MYATQHTWPEQTGYRTLPCDLLPSVVVSATTQRHLRTLLYAATPTQRHLANLQLHSSDANPVITLHVSPTLQLPPTPTTPTIPLYAHDNPPRRHSPPQAATSLLPYLPLSATLPQAETPLLSISARLPTLRYYLCTESPLSEHMTLTLTTTALSILLATGSTLHDTFGLLHRNGHILTPARATDTTGHVAGAWTLGDATRIPVAIATLAASMRRSPNRRIGRRAPQERIAHIIIVRFVEGGGDPVICEGWLGVRGTESWTATLALVGEGSARFERVGGNGNAGSGEGRRKGRRERHTHHGSESISGGETREDCKQRSRQTAVHAEHERIVTQNSRASSTSSYVEPDYMTARMHEMTFHDDKAGNESSTPHFRAAESSLEVSSGEDGGLQGVGNTMHDSSYHTDQHSYYEDEDGEDDMDELCRRYLQCGYHEELQRVMNAMD